MPILPPARRLPVLPLLLLILLLPAPGAALAQDKPGAQTEPAKPAAGRTQAAAPPVRSLPQFQRFLPTPRHSGAALPSWHPVRQSTDGQWTLPSRDTASTRYSPLNQITAGNVRKLRHAWSFSTGFTNGHESAPLVVGSTMYLVTPFPNRVYALDLARPGGAKRWEYTPSQPNAAKGVACCDVVNRGLAHADGKLVFNTLDAHTIALDAESGKELWKTKVGEIERGETTTMAPLVVNGKVLVGNSGGEMGVRGWIKALDLGSGKLLWTAYSTGPDSEVLIGEDFKAYYPKDRGRDLGVSTWPAEAWKTGGGTVWGWISHDPELNLIYYGTGNPGPWNPDQRPGDNKWTLTIFARNADTGQAVWAYQIEPHDLYDYDGVNELILLDLPHRGTMRKVLVRPERNGHMYVLDRATGELLSAETFAHVNVTRGVDLQTGELRKVPEKATGTDKTVSNICPAAPGAKDWQPSAYSQRTGLIYLPHNNLCMDMRATQASYIAGVPYVGAKVHMYPGPGGHRGEFSAWDPVAAKKIWHIRELFPVWSGALATAGDVVFYGTMDRWFKAVHARTGEVLWQYRTGSGIVGQPITFLGPDKRQYVAVFSGVGGWAGAIVAGELDARDGTSALGFTNAMKDLPAHTSKGGELHVFALP